MPVRQFTRRQLHEAIAHAAHRFDAVFAEFGAEVGDVDINHVGTGVEVKAVKVENIKTTAKTLPGFEKLWERMLGIDF